MFNKKANKIVIRHHEKKRVMEKEIRLTSQRLRAEPPVKWQLVADPYSMR